MSGEYPAILADGTEVVIAAKQWDDDGQTLVLVGDDDTEYILDQRLTMPSKPWDMTPGLTERV